MEVAPLIHSRTGQCDYNSKFAVRPNGFSEIQWARSKILAATRNIDRFNGIRRIVAAKNGICIAGIVCTMKYFVNNCLTGEDKDAAQPYVDVHGRLYGVFIGYAFKGNANEIPIVTYSDLWQWFSKYLIPEWEKKSARTVEVDYFSWSKVKPAHVTNHGTEFYDSAAFNEESLFEEYLSRALTEEVAFCSNVENIQAVEDGIYTAVTTSASNVDKLKANMERKHREREEQIRREKEEREKQKKLAEKEKKNEQIRSTGTIRQSNAAEAYGAYKYSPKATINTKCPEFSVGNFIGWLNTLCRDKILYDAERGRRFKVQFSFRETINILLKHELKIECKLEEIDGESV